MFITSIGMVETNDIWLKVNIKNICSFGLKKVGSYQPSVCSPLDLKKRMTMRMKARIKQLRKLNLQINSTQLQEELRQ